jgi:hypothetical protein
MMALAIGCAPAEQAAEPAATEAAEEMGHDDSMAMPDSAAMDSMSHEGHDEGSGH